MRELDTSKLGPISFSAPTHELKVHPQFWEGLASGAKSFEIRRDDRKFKVGDKLTLMRYDPGFGYTGETVSRTVTYVLRHEDFPIGLQRGFVALGFGR